MPTHPDEIRFRRAILKARESGDIARTRGLEYAFADWMDEHGYPEAARALRFFLHTERPPAPDHVT
jgi:hypothetical protein